MPTYDYECKKCKHTFENFQNFSEPDLKKCPKCGGTLKRLIGKGAGIIFKGSGFYETDYRRKESNNKADKKAKVKTKNESDEKKNATSESSKAPTEKPAAEKSD